jgi:hypothetical protein
LAIAMIGTTALEAQRRAHFGARAGYDVDIEEFAVGAQVSIPVSRRVELYPSVDRYFIDPGSLWSMNADLKVKPTTQAEWLYLGGGLNIMKRDVGPVDDTDAGFNMLLGAESRRGWIHPFADARLTLSDANRFLLAAGLNITLGHRSSASRAGPGPR